MFDMVDCGRVPPAPIPQTVLTQVFIPNKDVCTFLFPLPVSIPFGFVFHCYFHLRVSYCSRGRCKSSTHSISTRETHRVSRVFFRIIKAPHNNAIGAFEVLYLDGYGIYTGSFRAVPVVCSYLGIFRVFITLALPMPLVRAIGVAPTFVHAFNARICSPHVAGRLAGKPLFRNAPIYFDDRDRQDYSQP